MKTINISLVGAGYWGSKLVKELNTIEGIDNVEINDEVVLGGDGLAADEVAAFADTIAYELFCKVTKRVPRIYV